MRNNNRPNESDKSVPSTSSHTVKSFETTDNSSQDSVSTSTSSSTTTTAPPSSLLSNALSSACAGAVGRVCTHPLDTAKARLQAAVSPSSRPYRGVLDVLRHTVRHEGIRHGWYRGFGVVILGGTPGTIMYLCTYDVAKERFSRTSLGQSEFGVHFCAGLLAETLACVVYVPVDVVKERMQVSVRTQPGSYRGTWDAVQQISQREGFFGLYRGYAATLASFGPFSALYFVCYEQFKYQTRKYLTGRNDSSSWELDKVELPFAWLVTCSASAGAVASFLTSPLDLAKLRLQVSRGNRYAASMANSTTTTTTPEYPSYRGMVDCLQQAFRQDGVRGLFRGAGARVLYFAPATTVTMTCYETCRSFVNKLL